MDLALRACGAVCQAIHRIPRVPYHVAAAVPSRVAGVYLIYTPGSTLFYVGKAANIPARLRGHLKPWGTLLERLAGDRGLERTPEVHHKLYTDVIEGWRVAQVRVREALYKEHAYKTELFVQLLLMPKHGTNRIYATDLHLPCQYGG